MNVKKLISLLNKIEDKESIVVVAVRTYTQAYPVGYLEIHAKDYLNQVGNEVRLTVSFPKGVSVSTRKTV